MERRSEVLEYFKNICKLISKGPKPKKSESGGLEQQESQENGEQSSSLTDEKPSRYDNSLGVLTKNFLNLLKRAPDGVIKISQVVLFIFKRW
jgi:hypothetical protein